jgi:hypothetical protein
MTKQEAWGVARAVYHSTDSGRTWTKVLDGDYSRIEYLRPRDVFAAGRNIATYTYKLK